MLDRLDTARSDPANAATRTRADEIRVALGEEIVRGKLAPGTALDESALAERFQVSRTPVREALSKLAESGLVEKKAHRGAMVAHPSQRELAGMFETMAELEALCAGLAAERMNAGQRLRLEMLHRALGEKVRAGDEGGYAAANVAFHEAIWSGTDNPYLASLTAETRLRVAPFRRAQFGVLGRLAASYAEHDVVVTAIQRGDKRAASEAMRAHIATVGVSYRRFAGPQG